MLKPPLHVLVVDDYLNMRRLMRNMLRQIGVHNSAEAADGPAALELMRKNSYDLIISDWNMEPMSGLQLLQTIRNDQIFSRIPFIMVTGTPEAAARAKQIGADDGLVKPLSAGALKEALERALAARR
jgi:two-component system chemotaxis response regulator CheY